MIGAGTGWPTVTLEELVVGGEISYGIVQPGTYDESGVPVVRVKDLGGGRIDDSAPLRVSPEINSRHSRTELVGGEVLISLVGSVGEVAIVPKSFAGWNVARAIAVLRPDAVPAKWLELCLSSPDACNQIDSLLNTTVQATLNLKDLKSIRVPAPSELEILAIAEVLGALDDKIAANRKLVEAAEVLSSTIYSSMLDDSVVPIPLSAAAQFINGKAFTKGASGTGRVVVRIAELNSGIGGSTVFSDIEVDDQYVARPGDILFAWSGSLTLHRWFRDQAIVNQHIFKVIPSSEYPQWLVFHLIQAKLPQFKDIAADKATTMGHIQRRHLDEAVPVPSRSQIVRYDEAMTALWDRTLVAEREALQLSSLRDTLLPRLMSGELRVRDAERAVESVL